MTRRDKIRALAHLPACEAAKAVGVSPQYVHTARWQIANQDNVSRRQREWTWRTGHRRPMDVYLEQRKAKTDPLYKRVDALLSKGMTYSAIASELGLKSRNVVAGIAHRSKRRSSA